LSSAIITVNPAMNPSVATSVWPDRVVSGEEAWHTYHVVALGNTIEVKLDGEKILKPMLRPYDTVGSTRYVDFDTTRPVYPQVVCLP